MDAVYGVLSGDDPLDRACEAIPDRACAEVPRNYLLNVLNGACSKLGEQLASAGLVLPWALAAGGVPAGYVGLLAPVRQVGALLPQLAVAGHIRSAPCRKWYWTGAGLVQAAALLFMIAALALPPAASGTAILGLLAAFAVASGIGSVAFQDVVGKTIPRGRRGRLLGNRALIGGGLTVAAGLVLHQWLGDDAGLVPFAILLAVAAALWAGAALAFAAITEFPGAVEGGRNALAEARQGWVWVRGVAGYRRYLLARALLVAVEVAMPIYALHAHGLFAGMLAALGTYIVAVGAAGVIASPFWGAFSDSSARRTMAAAACVGAVAGLLALGIAVLPPEVRAPWMYAAVFAVLAVAEAGARLGRKTYLVDAAPEHARPLLVAFANTSVGAVTLVFGAVGLVAQVVAPAAAVAILAASAALAAVACLAMPEADAMMGAEAWGR